MVHDMHTRRRRPPKVNHFQTVTPCPCLPCSVDVQYCIRALSCSQNDRSHYSADLGRITTTTTATTTEVTYTEVSGGDLLQFGTLGVETWTDGGVGALTVQRDAIVFLENHLHTTHPSHTFDMNTKNISVLFYAASSK